MDVFVRLVAATMAVALPASAQVGVPSLKGDAPVAAPAAPKAPRPPPGQAPRNTRQPAPAGASLQKQVVAGQLTNPELNFTITSPGPDWEWLIAPTSRGAFQRTFVCTSPGGVSTYAISVLGAEQRLDDLYMHNFFKGTTHWATQEQVTVDNTQFSPASLPIPGNSYRFSYSMKTSEDDHVPVVGYIGSAGLIYQLMASESPESDQFRIFVASFRLLEPTTLPAAASARGNPQLTGAYVLWALIGAFIAYVVRRFTGQPKVRGPWVALMALAALLVARVVLIYKATDGFEAVFLLELRSFLAALVIVGFGVALYFLVLVAARKIRGGRDAGA